MNETICKSLEDLGLSSSCLDIEKLGNAEAPFYSCASCPYNYISIKLDSKGKKDCAYKNNNLTYCSEGEADKDGNNKCTKCVENAAFNSDSGVCECNSDCFGRNGLCYKCDDKNYGDIGCKASKGCKINQYGYNFVCNECKEGYYLKNEKCNFCSNEIYNCQKCHLDINTSAVKCDECKDIYTLNTFFDNSTNSTKDECVLNNCKEYPEISPGCVICDDKLDEYKKNKKCQSCKYGYFKTKEESCVYCRSEKYGGPACYECEYEEDKDGKETDNIICKDCFSSNSYTSDSFNSIISSDGKCYSYKYDLSELCMICDFSKDEKNSKELKCLLCKEGYYVDSDGKCTKFLDKIETIPNCNLHEFTIDNFTFRFYNSPSIGINPYNSFYTNENNYSSFNEAWRNLKSNIKPKCRSCRNDAYLNDKGECQTLDIKDCKGSFILENPNERIDKCSSLCSNKNYQSFYMKFTNGTIDFEYDSFKNINYYTDDVRSISSIFRDYIYMDNKTKEFLENIHLCFNSSNRTIFQGCSRILYIPKTNTYNCINCEYFYVMDNETNICKLIENDETTVPEPPSCRENIGNESHPLYTYNCCTNKNDVLVEYESGIKRCIYNYYYNELEGCLEANISSKYAKTLFNYYKCKEDYLPYESKFYRRKICQNVFEKIIKKKNISLEKFDGEEYIEATNGICPSNYFTPNGKLCYKCDNEKVGMPGCKGNCNFSLKRNDEIICESECKEGYIETSEGICKACDQVNDGCYQCQYKNNSNYLTSLNQSIFQCDYCLEGYLKNEDGICSKCSTLFSKYCEKCEFDGGSYKCTKYNSENDFYCGLYYAKVNNKCIYCYDSPKGCVYCESNEEGNGTKCLQCEEKYILMSNNNTCLEREKNRALYEFESCLILKEENNKLECSKCKPYYSLLKIGDEFKCSYIPTLYDENFNRYYYYHISKKEDFAKNDFYFRQNYFFPCKETSNLGSNENPLYTCNKCYDIFEDEDTNYEYYSSRFNDDFYEDKYLYVNGDYFIYYYPIKVNDSTSANTYCYKAHDYYQNCSEADYFIENGQEIFNCTKCVQKNELTKIKEIYKYDDIIINYDDNELDKLMNISDIYFCAYTPKIIKEICLVKYCKGCVLDKNYFCSECISSDYELNDIGSYVKKLEFQPVVSWKDIYNLNMTSQKTINGRIINGPTFKIRGISCSEISRESVYIFYLTLKLKQGASSNLEETKKVPSICVIENDFEKNTNRINYVDADYVVNETIDENYEISNIEGENLNKTIFPEKINNKEPTVTLPVVFVVDSNDLKDISSNNNEFKFTLNGKLTEKGNNPKEINNIELEMKGIDEKAICDFKSDDQLKANLDCILKLKNSTEIKSITFKNSEIPIEGSQGIYVGSLEMIHLINGNIQPEPPLPTETPSQSSGTPTQSSETPSQSSEIPSESSENPSQISENQTEEICMVDYCQSCILNKNYFCLNCNSSDYEVNDIGSCVRKLIIQPAITWKDIYNLTMVAQKVINERIINGPTFRIRGITCSQIYRKFIFIFYLTFKLKAGQIILDEIKKIPAICEIENDIEKKLLKLIMSMQIVL